MSVLVETWRLEHTFAPVGRPTGNAVAERVIRTMKEEVVRLRDWETAEELRTALVAWQHRYNDHFGNLRGKNQYIGCDAVYFTHLYRKPDEFYLGLELLLAGFDGYPRQWTSKNADPWNVLPPRPRSRPRLHGLRPLPGPHAHQHPQGPERGGQRCSCRPATPAS